MNGKKENSKTTHDNPDASYCRTGVQYITIIWLQVLKAEHWALSTDPWRHKWRDFTYAA